MHLTRWLDFDFPHTLSRLTSNHTSASFQTHITGFSVENFHAYFLLFEDLTCVCFFFIDAHPQEEG